MTAPSGWKIAALAPAAAGRVLSGQVLKASWQIGVPPDAHPGQAPVTVQAVYAAGDQRGVSYGSVSVLGAYATVADAFNNTGISADNDVASAEGSGGHGGVVPPGVGAADFDGTGTSYSEQALTTVAFGPGAVITP